MPRYKPYDRNPKFIPVVFEDQIVPGSFEFALDHLVSHELDLSRLDARFNNDVTGAAAYDPRVMLKIVLLAYSRGVISSRHIEQACRTNVQFMVMRGEIPSNAKDFKVEPELNHCRCQAGQLMYASGMSIQTNGYLPTSDTPNN